ncbi:membrane protein [Nocardia sp. BMG51109]|uniref:DoxX family protein n=1 Tax=Nocardia sp. BMG51109 TaxID=1056816 RepID=UPI000466E0C3|nr:membrane protein [Nocardia sp. BMG51109]
MTDSAARPRRAQLMAAALFGMGTLHFVIPKPFDSIVPRVLPGSARTYTYLSGVAELGVATTLALPSTRRFGGLLAVLLFVAVYPANVQMAVDSVRNPQAPFALKAVSVLRLPLQIPMMAQAWKIRREAA